MIPYLEPFTMPDGSTRRAIVERVPECRPKGDESTSLGTDPRMGRQANFAWLHKCEYPCCRVVGCEPVGALEALALCRVAVEDWLLNLTTHEIVVGFDAKGISVWSRGKPFLFKSDGQQMADALNAAAHSVSDAKGIAP